MTMSLEILPRCALLFLPTLSAALPLGAQEKELLPPREFDLETLVQGLEDLEKGAAGDRGPEKLESLSALAPAWLGATLDELIQAQTKGSLLKQAIGVLGSFLAKDDSQQLQDNLGGLSLRLFSRLQKLEARWQQEEEPSLALLVGLEKIYDLLAGFESVRRMLAPYPWRDGLAMLLSETKGLKTEQLRQLFLYLDRLPRQASKLHFKTGILLLRAKPKDEVATKVLHHLSTHLRHREQFGRALLCLQEAFRLQQKEMSCADWLSLGSAYARTGLAAKAETCLQRAKKQRQVEAADKHTRGLDRGLVSLQKFCAASHLFLKLVDSKVAEDQIRLCAALVELGHLRRAYAGYAALYKKDVKEVRILCGLGLIALDLGDSRRAAVQLEMADELLQAQGKADKTDPPVSYYELQTWLFLPTLGHAVLAAARRDDQNSRVGVAKILAKLRAAVGGMLGSGREDLRSIHKILLILEELTPALEQGDPALAIKILGKQLPEALDLPDSDPENPTYLRILYALAVLAEDRQLARKVLLRPLPEKLADHDRTLARLRVHAFFKIGAVKTFPGFEKELAGLIDALPTGNLEGCMLMGAVHAIRARQTGDAKRWQAAAEQFAKANTTAKAKTWEKGWALNNLAMARAMQGQEQEARALLQEAFEQDPVAAAVAGFNRRILGAKPDLAELAKIPEKLGQSELPIPLELTMRGWLAWLEHQAGHDAAARQQARQILALRKAPSSSRTLGVAAPGIFSTGSVNWGLETSTEHPIMLKTEFLVQPWLTRPAPLTEQMLQDLGKK